MKVENMTSNSGNKIANQFIITDGSKKVFQSVSEHYLNRESAWEIVFGTLGTVLTLYGRTVLFYKGLCFIIYYLSILICSAI